MPQNKHNWDKADESSADREKMTVVTKYAPVAARFVSRWRDENVRDAH